MLLIVVCIQVYDIWVTLSKNTWSLDFSATKQIVTGLSSVEQNPGPIVSPSGSSSSELPEWETNSLVILSGPQQPDN